MDSSTFALLCVLLTCSVWTIQGKCVLIDDGLQDQDEVEVSAIKLPGVCWACKWSLNQVRKAAGKNATVEKFQSKLQSVCNQIGALKSLCQKFVKAHLGVLVEELTTTDDVRTICVNVKACKPKEAELDPELPKRHFNEFSGRYMDQTSLI